MTTAVLGTPRRPLADIVEAVGTAIALDVMLARVLVLADGGIPSAWLVSGASFLPCCVGECRAHLPWSTAEGLRAAIDDCWHSITEGDWHLSGHDGPVTATAYPVCRACALEAKTFTALSLRSLRGMAPAAALSWVRTALDIPSGVWPEWAR